MVTKRKIAGNWNQTRTKDQKTRTGITYQVRTLKKEKNKTNTQMLYAGNVNQKGHIQTNCPETKRRIRDNGI